jgi:WWE domain
MKAAVATTTPTKLKGGYATEEVSTAVTETRVVWECLVSGPTGTDQFWVPYDSVIQSALEESFQKRVTSFAFLRGGVRYLADFTRMKQCR